MDLEHDSTRPEIIVLCQSVTWCSAIRRNFTDTRLSWVLSVEGLLEEAFQGQSSAAIIEFPRSKIEETCQKLSLLANNSLNLKLFVVGDDGMMSWRPLLQAIDIAGCYGSMLQIPELVNVIQRHAQTIPGKEQSIEQRVISGLPWPSAAIEEA